MVTTATRSVRRLGRTAWWRLCGLGALVCAVCVAACLALRVRRRLPGVSVWEEARVRLVVAPGLRRLESYLQNHAAFDEYCRHRRARTI